MGATRILVVALTLACRMCASSEPVATLASSPRRPIPTVPTSNSITNNNNNVEPLVHLAPPASHGIRHSSSNVHSSSPLASSSVTISTATIGSIVPSLVPAASTQSSSSFSSTLAASSSSPASPALTSPIQAHLPPPLSVISAFNAKASRSSCVDGLATFELVTGYSYVGKSSDVIKTLSDVMNLPDCLHACLRLKECKSVNFETGLCILLNSSANYNELFPGAPSAFAYHQAMTNGSHNLTTIQGLKISQFPVFTIYAEKICLEGHRAKASCTNRSWTFERVIAFKMAEHLVKKKRTALNRIQCMEFCLDEASFECRSFNYNRITSDCWLFDLDRQGISSGQVLKRSAWLMKKKASEFHFDRNFIPSDHEPIDFFENNCIKDPKQCDFAPIKNLILKTVDSVYENVRSFEACKAKCLNAPYRCFSFDFGADSEPKSNGICRTSHLNTGSVVTIESPFAEMSGAITYQLVSCLNVTVECNGLEMVARIKTNRVFSGKIYSKSKPNSCVNDVTSSLDFSLTLPYNDIMCDVKHELGGNVFTSNLVIQHHDRIVTQSDFGVSVMCRFDLKNRTISNGPAINIDGSSSYSSGQETLIEATSVRSPNVTMKISDMEGNAITSARVGDTLNLYFDIIDTGTPYEIFVRDLVAVDGIDTNEIQLIDSVGCPTEMAIMTSVAKFSKSGKRLRTTFEAFKFPSSNTVQFRALITPCLSSCKPVQCNLLNTETGINQEFISYGRRRRWARSADGDVHGGDGNGQSSDAAIHGRADGEVIKPSNSHYGSVATSDQLNYRSMVHGITPGNRKAVNDRSDDAKVSTKDETSSNTNYHPHSASGDEAYIYKDQHSTLLHGSQYEATTQKPLVDPKSQVVVVGAIKISDSFDFLLDDQGKGNDADTVSTGNKQPSKGQVFPIDAIGDQVQVSSSLLRKSQTTLNANSNAPSTLATANGDSGNCTDLIGLVVACSVFLLGQLMIIATWFYMYKKVQMYQWVSSTLFNASKCPSSSASSSSVSSSTSTSSIETATTSPYKGPKCSSNSSSSPSFLAPMVQTYSTPAPPAPVRLFRSRYPFEWAPCKSFRQPFAHRVA